MEPFANFVAGWISGVMTLVAAHPFDMLKLRIQAGAGGFGQGVFGAVKQVWREGGILSFYKGFVPPALASGFSGALVFTTYGFFANMALRRKDITHDDVNFLNQQRLLSLEEIAVCGGLIAPIVCAFTTPVDLLKVRQQIHTTNPPPVVHILSQEIKQHGYRGLFRGYLLSLARDVPGYAAYFWAFHCMARTVSVPEAELTVSQHLLCGGVAGAMGWCAFPCDVIKSRVQSDPLRRSGRFWFNATIKSEGIRGLFLGMLPTLLVTFPVDALALITFHHVQATLHRVLGLQRPAAPAT
jgi:solute carrier family 25 carnitine/acylcarnitine transporter 20/29